MVDTARVQVLLPPDEAERFNDYCRRQGFKKSTLIARLVREHLEREDLAAVAAPLARTKPAGKTR